MQYFRKFSSLRVIITNLMFIVLSINKFYQRLLFHPDTVFG